MNSFKLSITLTIWAVSAMLPTVASAYSAGGFGPSQFNYPYLSNAADNYVNQVNDYAGWSTGVDATLYGQEFCDADLDPNDICMDDTGYLDLDTHDTSFLHTHGDGVGVFQMSSTAANPGGTGDWTGRTYWKVGDGLLEFFETGACQSANYGAGADVRSVSYGLHQWHGQHGDGGVAFGGNHIADYVDDAFDGNISQAWISNFTDFDYWPDPADVCGMSIVLGADAANCNTRRANEEYTNPHAYSDPSHSTQTSIYHYFCNCDPLNEDPTPNC